MSSLAGWVDASGSKAARVIVNLGLSLDASRDIIHALSSSPPRHLASPIYLTPHQIQSLHGIDDFEVWHMGIPCHLIRIFKFRLFFSWIILIIDTRGHLNAKVAMGP